MTPTRIFELHVLSAVVIALTGVGVILWALLSRPRIRWDRFWIGLALLLVVAPIASIVAVVRMANAIEAANGLEGDLDWSEIEMDSTLVVDSAGAAIGVDSVIAARVDTVIGIVVDTVAASTIESN
jgi:hypothetical protein